MNIEQKQLFRFLLALGDDSVVLGHRLSEWCSNAPYLEEDLALANVALDYIGRARLFYQYAVEVEGAGRNEDDLAYFRNELEYTNILLHELPNNDFAFSMLRQFYLDAYYCFYLAELVKSSDARIAAIAGKALKESRYHLKRSEPWIRQLAEGTDQSRRLILEAKLELNDFLGELFVMEAWESALQQQGIAVDRSALKQPWDQYIGGFLAESEIEFAPSELKICGGRRGVHTEHLGHMLTEMQYLQRAYPGLEW